VARLVLLRRLERSPATRSELALLLRRRGVPQEAADEALDRFEGVGLIDDAAFAEAWVRTRSSGKGLAARALAGELQRKGVAADLVAEALATLDPEAQRTTAVELARRRVPRLSGLAGDAAVRRLAGYLARKGYPAGLSYAVAREAVAEAGAGAAVDDEVSVDVD
jgi:regulatory protein